MTLHDGKKLFRVRKRSPVLFTHEGVDYLLRDSLDEGPLGEKVYLCRQRMGTKRGARVEVRVLDEQAPWKSHQRLMEMAQLGMRLCHSALGRVYGLHLQQGSRFLVIEHLKGISLNMAISFATLCGKRLSEPFTLYVGIRMAAALTYTHTLRDAAGRPLGLIHRDICPYNIIVDPDGQVRLLGVMTAFSHLLQREPIHPRVIRGELDFSAPERLCPEPEGKVDARSDLFSLGLVLLEMLTGLLLYATDEVEQAAGRLELNPLRYEGWSATSECWASVEEMGRRAEAFQPEHIERITQRVSPPLQRILHKLLRRDPSERYATAAELKKDLEDCLQGPSRSYGAPEALAELLTLQLDSEKSELGWTPSDDFIRDMVLAASF